jgi:hypothetical protein
MGFFSSAWKSLSGATKPTTTTSGTNNILSPAYQQYSDALTSAFKDVGLTTPTASEQKAFSMIGQGVTPTQESIQSDLAMLMNPYDQYYICYKQRGSRFRKYDKSIRNTSRSTGF